MTTAQRLLGHERVEVIFVDRSLLERALTLYAQRPDPTWGLVDCVSFEIMRGRGIVDAFTNDHHVEQAGFHRLLAQ